MTEQQQAPGLDPAQVEVDVRTGLGAPSPADSEAKQNSLWSDAWDSLKRNPLFWIGAVLGVVFLVMAIAPQLFARGAVSRAEYDMKTTSCKTTAAAAEAAENRAQQARQSLSDSTIRAPFRLKCTL